MMRDLHRSRMVEAVDRLRRGFGRLRERGSGPWLFKVLELTSVSLFLLIITEKNALAYTDPGSGALIWQMLVAALFSGLYYFHKLLARFRFRKKREGVANEERNTELN